MREIMSREWGLILLDEVGCSLPTSLAASERWAWYHSK